MVSYLGSDGVEMRKNLLTLTLLVFLGFIAGLEYQVQTLEPLQFPEVQSPQERPVFVFDSDMDTGIYNTTFQNGTSQTPELIHYVCNGEYVMTLPLCEVRPWVSPR